MIMSSVLFSVLFSVNLTSFLKFLMIMEVICLVEFLVNHHFFLRIKGKMKNSSHAVENKDELGSKTENKFVIILCYFLLGSCFFLSLRYFLLLLCLN